MTLANLLREKLVAITEKWRGETLTIYSAVSARALNREQDPFANPVGHALQIGMQSAVVMLAEGRTPAEIAAALEEIIQIRAVQELTPSQAVAFVFLLKDIIRREVLAATADKSLPEELRNCERQIDQVALAALDIYMQYRQRIYDLRIREIQRSVGMIDKKSNVCR